ncbi:MAG: A/G-specific adenine glycosylase [SAR324 cluster bacterium]|nr:A/G-specific adenine glycosylase [SAR324 cluster bacterium]
MARFQLDVFQTRLLDWFREFQRPLPWRKDYLPYQVWVSEIMLQQTQVTTVLPYYERWMRTLPDIKSLAQASEDTVLKQWEGLGYYSRASNLQKAAKIIGEQHENEFPSEFEIIRTLPGIGRYTAGAIASIVFNQNKPAVDGNVVRVICRLMDFRDNPKSRERVKTLWRLAEDWIPQGKARFFNQALMELGAMICSPKQPTCLLCPVQSCCQGFAAGSIEQIPAKSKRTPLKSIETMLAVIQDQKKFLIQKRPLEGLMGGLWEFPNVQRKKKEKKEKALVEEIRRQHGFNITVEQLLITIKHGYTSYKVQLHCFLCVPEEEIAHSDKRTVKWVTLNELRQFSFPAAHVKLIQILHDKMKNE